MLYTSEEQDVLHTEIYKINGKKLLQASLYVKKEGGTVSEI